MQPTNIKIRQKNKLCQLNFDLHKNNLKTGDLFLNAKATYLK